MNKIRLMIVDDHSLVRDGLRMTFADSDVDVVVEAADGQSALQALGQQPVDVALVDIRMPDWDGFYFLQQLQNAHRSSPAVLMHSVNDGAENRRRSREYGARGLLTKGLQKQELLLAIRNVHEGGEYWPVAPTAEL